MSEKNYSADDIIVISAAEAIRRRPAMYIGSLNTKAILAQWASMVYEICSNCPDQNLSVHWTQKSSHSFELEIKVDGTMPRMREYNEPELRIWSGGRDLTYEIFCALSEWLIVEVEGFQVRFEKGIRVGEPDFETPKQISQLRITCELNHEIFTQLEPQFDIACALLETITHQFPQLKLTLSDCTGPTLQRHFHSPNGINDCLVKIQGEHGLKTDQFFEAELETKDVKWKMAMMPNLQSNVDQTSPFRKIIINDQEAKLGAILENAVLRGLENGYCKYQNLPRSQRPKVNRSKVLIAIAAKMDYPQWHGPTRQTLEMPYLKSWLSEAIADHFAKYLEAHQEGLEIFDHPILYKGMRF